MFTRITKLINLLAFAIIIAAVSYSAGVSKEQLNPQELEFANLYERLSPSIVSISISERFAGSFEEISGGSGFVYDKEGHIITNFHVIDGVSRDGRIEVNFVDGTIVRADVVGKDADADVAVIQVDVPEDRLFPVTFADSDQLVIGQITVALGSPFGQKWTMTTGIISALDRTIQGLGEGRYQIGAVIQTDAAVNPGNSGGPLLNLQGHVLGINSQIISEDRVNAGIAFAVPSNLVQRVVVDLINEGEVEYAYLGIQGEDITLDLIEDLELPNNTRGVAVTGFGNANGISPARDGGIERDDIITAIDDQPVISFGTLIAYLSTWTRPAQTVKLTVLRDGELLDLDVVLGNR